MENYNLFGSRRFLGGRRTGYLGTSIGTRKRETYIDRLIAERASTDVPKIDAAVLVAKENYKGKETDLMAKYSTRTAITNFDDAALVLAIETELAKAGIDKGWGTSYGIVAYKKHKSMPLSTAEKAEVTKQENEANAMAGGAPNDKKDNTLLYAVLGIGLIIAGILAYKTFKKK